MVAEVVASLSQTHPITRSAPRNHRKHYEEHEKKQGENAPTGDGGSSISKL